MIFDTNVLIYISKQIFKVKGFLEPKISPQILVISYIEALRFQFASGSDRFFMEEICNSCNIINLSDQIITEAIRLRSNYKIKLPDAIIYATAAVQNLPLLTNNIADFSSLNNQVYLINPFTL